MIFKVSAVAVLAALAAVSLRKANEHYSILIIIASSVIIGAFILSSAVQFISGLGDLVSLTDVNGSYLKILLKCLGVSIITGLASDICEDSSYSALAAQITLAGKCVIIALSLPVLRSVLEICLGFIK